MALELITDPKFVARVRTLGGQAIDDLRDRGASPEEASAALVVSLVWLAKTFNRPKTDLIEAIDKTFDNWPQPEKLDRREVS